MLHHIGAMSTVEIKQDLGVAMAPEHDAFSEELVAQAFVVVDLAVERDPRPAVGRRHRLRALGPRIDDREPPVTEPHAPVAGIPFPDSVGPARCHMLARAERRIHLRTGSMLDHCFIGQHEMMRCHFAGDVPLASSLRLSHDLDSSLRAEM